MKKEHFKQIIIEYQEYLSDIKFIRRHYAVEKNANYVFVGQRRVGKTYFMFQIIEDLIKSGTDKEQILYINFEDERLLELKTKDLQLIIESYKELYDLKPILFFDEIQNVKNWEKFVRRLSDQKYRIYITGSNAELLSKEIATTLGGRFLIKEIHSLSFKEFLDFKSIKLQENFEFKEQKYQIIKLFEEYFYYGGFPETINFKNKKEYLSNLYQKVFYGDIVSRYKVNNNFALKLLIKKIAENTNDATSFNRLKNVIKAVGVNVGTNTLINYFTYLEDAFFIYDIKNYNSKFAEKESIKKFYFADNGILNLFLLEPESKLLETLVFNTLRTKYKSENIYYYRDKIEIDFYLPKKELIQVSYDLQYEKTRNRKINAILKAKDELKASKYTIITYNEEEIIEIKNTKIELIPVWKWVLKF
ncbi:MAG: ATP-binding protein [Bacteroidales bacterium]|nr:ATP-binding protein [Bacteroidales bacterium]